MITKNTFYIGDYYIPQAKPSISDAVAGAGNDFIRLVDIFEEECLIKCLGDTLYREFASQLDLQQNNLLAVGADAKWDQLLNGHTYTVSGKQKVWKGIRFKTPVTSADYNNSILVPYVYFEYKRTQYTSTTYTGEKDVKASNAEAASPRAKAVKAWNSFVDQVVGKPIERTVVHKGGFFGFDYYNGNQGVSLHEFIKDMNKDSIVYENFEPSYLERINEFGI